MADFVLPNSVQAEKALLGLMLQHKSVRTFASEQGVTATHFFDPSNQILFQTIMDVTREGKDADVQTVISRLNDQGDINKVGGSSAVLDVYNMGDAESKANQYIQTILKKALLRDLYKESTRVIEEIRTKSYDEDEILAQARANIVRIADSRSGNEFISSKDLMSEVLKDIGERKTKKNKIGIRTGLPSLDANTTGFKPGELVILAARTSVGKTQFAVNIATYAAVHEKKNIAFFTLEMNASLILTRMLAVDGVIPSQQLKTGDLEGNNANLLMESGNRLANAGIYIDESSSIRVGEILAKCKKLKSDLEAKGQTLDLILVDYLQLIQSSSRASNSREQDVSESSRGLKELARAIGCPVIALAQLNRESVKRSAPQLQDLRESGAIEQDADLVLFLSNIGEGQENNIDRDVLLTVAKNRQGSTMHRNLKFDTTCGIFKEQIDLYEEPDV